MNRPPIVASNAETDCLKLTLGIREDLGCFRGHFPQMPVLAGVVQVHWAVELAMEHFGLHEQPLEVHRLKFKNVALPPLDIELTLTRSNTTDIRFVYTSPGHQYSEGLLRFPDNSS